jgi:hypothetical protein
VDEIILNKSIEYLNDEKTKELQYSISIHNGSASDLVNIDFNNCADDIEDWNEKLLKAKQAGTPARMVVRPIPEEESTENTATNADEQTTVENEGSIENANANEEKETTVENEGAALIKASKNTATTQEKKGTKSKKASQSNCKSLPELLDSRMKKKTKMKTNTAS